MFPFDFVHCLIFNIKHFSYICSFYHTVLRQFSFALPFLLLATAVPSLPKQGAEWVQQTECGKHVFDRVLFRTAPALPLTALLWLTGLVWVFWVFFGFYAFHDKPNTLCRKAVGVLCLIRQYDCRIKTI